MYYESRINTVKDLTTLPINYQVEALKQLSICNALKIGNIIWVNDENPSGCGIKEIAVLYLENDVYKQFESITVPWCKNSDIESYIKDFSNTKKLIKDYNLHEINPIKFNASDELRHFICGCCGSYFKSTIKIQKVFDQDVGYGICSTCV